MKIAWLIWEDESDQFPILVPEDCRKLDYCFRKVRVVYAEIQED